MIRWATAIRLMPAIWLAPLVSGAAAVYATLLYPGDGYAVAATAAGMGALPIVAVYCAATSAWEGSRLRGSGNWWSPIVRSRLRVAWQLIAPSVIGGFVAACMAVGVQLLAVSAWPPDALMILTIAADVLTYSVAGLALGLLLPRAVALPLSVIGPVIWLAFVPAIPPPWLRHLTGMFRDCCQSSESLDPRAVLASLLASASILAIAWLVSAHGREQRPPLHFWAVPVALLAAGVALISGGSHAPTVARDESILICTPAGTGQLCLWPEHGDRLEVTAGLLAAARTEWQVHGTTVPELFTEAAPATSERSTAHISTTGVVDRDSLIGQLAAGLMPPIPECPFGATGPILFPYLHAYYASVAGASDAWIERQYGTDPPDERLGTVLAVMDRLSQLPAERQRVWTGRAITASQYCDEDPIPALLDP